MAVPPIDDRYLKPEDVRRLRHRLFAGRRPVEGQWAGRHRSPRRGHSVEFVDWRAYQNGDDVSDIDWKIYGRTDRLYVRLSEHQADMTVHLVVDASASMAYGPKPDPSKYDHAARLAASIAYLLTHQGDRVGLTVAGARTRRVEAGGSPARLPAILDTLAAVRPAGRASLDATLHDVARRAGRRGVVVLISDLLDPSEPWLKPLTELTHRGFEAIVFQILHEHELNLPGEGETRFVDAETGASLAVELDEVREAYTRRMRRFMDARATALRARGIDHQVLTTGTDVARALEHYLFARAATA